MQPISHWAAVVGLVALALSASHASTQDLRSQDLRDYPNRTVTIVAPSAPGGGAPDLKAFMAAEAAKWGAIIKAANITIE
jgi:hypothetical protein